MSKNSKIGILAIGLIAILTGTGGTSTLADNREAIGLSIGRSRSVGSAESLPSVIPKVNTQAIATLANGSHLFCTEPPPGDWRSGAGVCFNFVKIGDRASGYYGYPYTDDFICVRGKIKGHLVTGEALMVSWRSREWNNIPKTAFKWDDEGNLLLKDGKIIRTTIDESGRTDWMLFGSAKLDTKGFYRSTKSALTPPSQLCKWK